MAFNAFVNEFTAAPLQTSYNSYLELDFSLVTSIQLEWSFENQNTLYPFSNVIQAINTSSTDHIILPDATITSAGTTTVIINTGSNTITVYNFTGSVVATLETTQQWQITLTDNSTSAGIWIALQLGSTTSSVSAASLIDPTFDANDHSNAGGLKAFTSYLKQNVLVNTYSSGNLYTQASGDRGALLVWSAGTGTYQCLNAETLGEGFCFAIQNNSAGSIITVAPSSDAGQTINGLDDTLNPYRLNPDQSSLFVSDGVDTIYSYGSSLSSTSVTTLVEINLNEQISGVITLDDAQADASIQVYIGTVGSGPYTEITINYPADNINEYIVYNASTTNVINVKIVGEVNATYIYPIQPLNTAFFFSDGTHLYCTPTALYAPTLYSAQVYLKDGGSSIPSLAFNSDATTGLFRANSGTYSGQLCVTQLGTTSACFANSTQGSNTSLNSWNTVGGTYFDSSISIYTLMRAYG